MGARNARVKDPTNASGGRLNVMPSGLIHCADSLSGGREGSVTLRQGAPGDPLQKSGTVSSGYMGSAPDIQKKFMRKGQS